MRSDRYRELVIAFLCMGMEFESLYAPAVWNESPENEAKVARGRYVARGAGGDRTSGKDRRTGAHRSRYARYSWPLSVVDCAQERVSGAPSWQPACAGGD